MKLGCSGFSKAAQKAFLMSIGEDPNNLEYNLCQNQGNEAKCSQKIIPLENTKGGLFNFYDSADEIYSTSKKVLIKKGNTYGIKL